MFSKLRTLSRITVLVLLSPWRGFLSVRRSMTGASVSVLLIGIISLNIVWGYPWTGMFAASISLLFVGWCVSRIMRPVLRVGFSLPTSSPAGTSFTVTTHLENCRHLPAMDLRVTFGRTPRRKGKSRRDSSSEALFRSLSSDHSVAMIHPHERVDLGTSIRFDHRGVHALPDIVVTSMFPFHLFRSTRRFPSNTLIAITPRPLDGGEDAYSRGMLSALGQWSHKLLAGDALDYTGSREYQDGMSVRRWDFTSWARLGRPIIREFQSPTVQTITLIVDTSVESQIANQQLASELIERLLSMTATSIIDLTRKLVRLRLYVTSEDPADITAAQHDRGASTDSESLLIRLAGAERVSAEEADLRTTSVMEHVSNAPVLVLTSRPNAQVWDHVPATVTVLRIDAAHTESSSVRNAKSVRQRPANAKPDTVLQGGL